MWCHGTMFCPHRYVSSRSICPLILHLHPLFFLFPRRHEKHIRLHCRRRCCRCPQHMIINWGQRNRGEPEPSVVVVGAAAAASRPCPRIPPGKPAWTPCCSLPPISQTLLFPSHCASHRCAWTVPPSCNIHIQARAASRMHVST